MATSNLSKYFLEGAMQAFVDIPVMVEAFSFKAEPVESCDLNDVIRVPFYSNASASGNFTYAAGYSGNGQIATGKAVTLDKWKYQLIAYTDGDFAKLGEEGLRQLGYQAGARLVADVITDIVQNGLSASAFTSTSSFSAGQFTSSAALADITYMADTAKWNETRTLIATPTLWKALLQNSTFTNASSFGNAAVVQDGKFVTNGVGWNPVKTTITMADSRYGYAVHKNALVVGNGYCQPQPDLAPFIVESGKLTDPKTGLTLGFYKYANPATRTVMSAIDILYGYATADSTAAIGIK